MLDSQLPDKQESEIKFPEKLVLSEQIEKSAVTYLKELFPSKTVKALIRHTISASTAIACFGLTGRFAAFVFSDVVIKSIIHWMEVIGIVLVFSFLLVEFFREIIRGKSNE